MDNDKTQWNSLRFLNSGTVTRDMRFEYRSRPCHYMEDPDQWATRYLHAYYNYLYLIEDGQECAPPSGMRSAVPLGGMGAGTVELRADGSFRDWTIFNNSPAGGVKIQLDDALFYLWIKEEGRDPILKTLRTHPPMNAAAIEKIEYSGAYPVSRLAYTDSDLPVRVTLHALSEFHPYDAEASATPAIIFRFTLENLSDQDLDVSLMSVLPNAIEGEYELGEEDRLLLDREGTGPVSGGMALLVNGEDFDFSSVMAESLLGIQREYAIHGEIPPEMRKPQKKNPVDGAVGRMYAQPRLKRYGALAANTKLKAGESRELRQVLAWHFPHRPHTSEVLGNYYSKLYGSAEEAAEKVMLRIPQTLEAILAWQSLCFDNALPENLQDALCNSVATMAKTGMWFADGRWRQWESFSCPGVDPIHIHFYRVLPYAWWFKELRRSQLRGFKSQQREDGYIEENLGRGTDVLDKPIGRMIGDACTTYILEVYQDYLWTADRAFFDELWPSVKRATQWQIERAEKFGVPQNIENSYDWWGYHRQDMASYNAFLHLAALAAAEKCADVQGDDTFAETCRDARQAATNALHEHLWNGEFYLAYKNLGIEETNLMSDTLYGQLWAFVLDLGLLVDKDKLLSHLASEQKINGTAFGLKVMDIEGRPSDALEGTIVLPANARGLNELPRDEIVWEAGSLDWASLMIYLTGQTDEALAEAGKILDKWQQHLKDQWDIRDLSNDWNGEPYCNSHYARQVIMWALPLALSGQRYDAASGRLSFAPRIKGDCVLPFMTPQASGLLKQALTGSIELTVLAGTLAVDTLEICGIEVARNLTLTPASAPLSFRPDRIDIEP